MTMDILDKKQMTDSDRIMNCRLNTTITCFIYTNSPGGLGDAV